MLKVAFFLIVFFASNLAYAGSCPLLMKEIDQLIEQSKQLSKEQLAEIKQLRQQGEEAHNQGDHKESEDLLKQALELLDG
jgi:mevalonate kinase